MDKKKFWVRFIIFILIGIVAPIGHVIGRFHLFTQINKTNVGLLGVIVLIIVGVVLKTLMSYYLEGMKTKYSLLKQIVKGFSKLILPLAITLAILVLLKDNIHIFIETAAIVLPCECIAVVVNPLPKWAFENNVEGLGEITDKIFSRNKKIFKKEK